ncbi:hypothetical protein CGCS363_v005792 [Colletotrichum siamense]|uniref:uncharacterized protein n=1 Tax=Colletotrichum siamense TaxID=690259 RepID=UPI001872BB75|nr:uncharacterized protein CGCS363_v005792 [Colletotrichum siamense]KAF5505454.1 hypothetical protein CGCS363_v005792 [Colletotrichum siamense]
MPTLSAASGASSGTGCMSFHSRLTRRLCPRRFALWVFLLSAAGHALVNWVMYRRGYAASEFSFFVLNWAVCLCEHVLGVDGRRMSGRLASKPPSTARRIAGIFSVWLFFFCTVPAWQYPGVYDRS